MAVPATAVATFEDSVTSLNIDVFPLEDIATMDTTMDTSIIITTRYLDNY